MQTFNSKTARILRSPLFWLMILYVVVGVVYTQVTPILEKPDEEGHYGYIVYLREHRALPPIAPTANMLMFESKQPPLYYVVAAALTSWLPDVQDPERLLITNPYVDRSVPGYRNDNRNVYLHPPYLTPVIVGARLVSLAFGLGTVLASYFMAAQLFPKSQVPILTAAVVAFQPQFLYIATAVNNDTAIACLGAWTLALLIFRMKKGDKPYWAVTLGVILGLTSITKVSALVFFPLTGLALLLIHRGLRPAFFRDSVIIAGVALVVGGWWYAHNALAYGDPLTLGAHYLREASPRSLVGRLKHDLMSIEYTFWANPSRLFISPSHLDQLLIWGGRISLGLLVLRLLLGPRWNHIALPDWIVLLSWPVTFFLLLVFYWNQTTTWTWGRLLFPSIAPIVLLWVMGWQAVVPSHLRRLVATVCGGTVMVAGSLMPFMSIYPLYNPSREDEAKQVQHSTNIIYVDTDTGQPVARLIGYNLRQSYIMPGTYVPIELCWEPLGYTFTPYAVFVHLLDLHGSDEHSSPRIWGQRETYPGLGSRPTDRWALGRSFCDTVLMWVFPETPTPLGTAFEVGFVNPESGSRLQAIDIQNDPVDLALIGHISVLSSQDLPVAKRPARYIIDNAVGLDHVQVEGSENSITLTLTWQSLQPVSYDGTLFIHLKATGTGILAQADREPLDGRFSTSYWLPGQIITDVVNLPLTPDQRAAPLVLNMGMYTWPSLQRLPVTDASGTTLQDNIIVIDIPTQFSSGK